MTTRLNAFKSYYVVVLRNIPGQDRKENYEIGSDEIQTVYYSIKHNLMFACFDAYLVALTQFSVMKLDGNMFYLTSSDTSINRQLLEIFLIWI
jgi:hypothetical protein